MNEKELIEKAKDKSNEAIKELLMMYGNLIEFKISKYYIAGMDLDDLRQEAKIAFLDGVNSYDEGRGNFSSFIALCIDRHFINLIQNSKRQKNMALNSAISMQTQFGDDESLEVKDKIESSTLSPEEIALKRENLNESFMNVYNMLSEFEKKVFLQYVEGFEIGEIANNLGAEYKVVDNAMQRIKGKLKKK